VLVFSFGFKARFAGVVDSGRSGSDAASIDEAEIRRLWPRLLHAATKRLGRAGLHEDPADIVQAALMAIAMNQKPPEVPLDVFLRMKIKNVVGNRARSAKRKPIDLLALDDLEQLLADPPSVESRIEERDLAVRVLTALIESAAASDDTELFLILEAYKDGARVRRDLIEESGLTPTAFDAGRKRLATLCRNLPQELREAASDMGVTL
jgi:DNA-directed RNA polymerase specialized sigma24 family protein